MYDKYENKCNSYPKTHSVLCLHSRRVILDIVTIDNVISLIVLGQLFSTTDLVYSAKN